MKAEPDKRASGNTNETTVYALEHVYKRDDEEQIKFIGVYDSVERAQAAIIRLSSQPGFCDHPEGFQIDHYQLNKDHWTEGFFVARWDEDGNDIEG